MHKLRVLFFLIGFPVLLFAQEKRTIIVLQSSTSLKVDTKTNINYVKNPVFRQDNATLTCDSAVFYKDRNFFEAFKNVHINQGDTVNIFSDFLDYDGNKKLAHLSGNVRLVDPTSILTTNLLDYYMATKIGQYYNGGKIVSNKEVTLTSKRGWYFANTKDAFFRYNVVVVTPQSTIKSDTLRYNTFSNWTYFYGPTNIKGKDDNLYTEDGAYNTKSENAYFGKKNLYTQGTKSLKGDSLYYYGKIGYGKAVKNIVFKDTSDQTILYGQLGEYYKADERVVVTKKAYFGMGTKDSVTVNNKKIPDTLWLGADTLEAQKVLQQTLKLLPRPVILKDNEVGADDEKAKIAKEKERAEAKKQAAAKATSPTTTAPPKPIEKKLSKKERKLADEQLALQKKLPPIPIDSIKNKLAIDSVRADSIKIANLKSKITTADTVKKVKENAKPAVKPTVTNTVVKQPVKNPKDTLKALNPADTVRTRVIKAFHNVRVFKSNMQAKADSLFYTAADSTLRWYKNPILWSDGSQQTGDTIHVFFKNNKIQSVQVLENGFIVNVETDSTKFNQVKGRKITGFFTDGELKNMYVDGNAESIYYSKDKGVYDKFNQSVSNRIRFKFIDKELTEISFIKEDEGVTYPIDKLPKETVLTGFIWKPELRPVSKADIINGKPTNKTIKATPKTNLSKPTAKPTQKTPVKKPVAVTTPNNTKTAQPNIVKPLPVDTTVKND